MNKLILMGRLTENPELKTTQNGVSVTAFTLAVDRNYTGKGQEKKTDFVKCVAWRNTADFITKYFTKGKLMAVESELQSRTYENSEGRKVTVWEAIVSQAFFCGDKKENSQNDTGVYFDETAEDDEYGLPF